MSKCFVGCKNDRSAGFDLLPSNEFRHFSIQIALTISGAPQGFWGSGENGYLFSGSWGALVIILGELGSKLIILGV